MTKISESISRIRTALKFTKEDAFMTDRTIYSSISKYVSLGLKKLEKEKKLFVNNQLFREIPCLELIEVSLIEACCSDIKTSCRIVRTKNKIPKIFNSGNGQTINYVASLDGSEYLFQTQPKIYTNIVKSTNFKYNKKNYYWIINDYMYFPNISWEGVKISAIWDEDISQYNCSSEQDQCLPAQEKELSIPDYMLAEVEQGVIQELSILYKVPSDINDDKINNAR